MAIEIVDFPIQNGGSFHSYVKLPEGMFDIPPPVLPVTTRFPFEKPSYIWLTARLRFYLNMRKTMTIKRSGYLDVSNHDVL